MPTHDFKNSTSPLTFDFIANPVTFIANSPVTINILATSTGATLSSTGNRLWNQAALPLSSTSTLATNQALTIPFIATNLPSVFFDAVILLLVNGAEKIPYAISTSPDNTEVSRSLVNKTLFWADLYCFGLSNNGGNNSTLKNYMFGGIPAQNDVIRQYKINFSKPLTVAFTYSWQVKYISYTLGVNSFVFSGTVTAPIGAVTHTFYNGNIVTPFNQANGSIPYNSSGYYELSFSHSSTDYSSLLKKYHWGVG